MSVKVNCCIVRSIYICNTCKFYRDPRSSHKTPEMLARYCDMLLKKSVKNYDDHELDEMLNLAVLNCGLILSLSQLQEKPETFCFVLYSI